MLDIGSTISSKEVNMAYKIKEIREKKRMSQAELAEISGVSRATIIRIESADNVVINTKTLEKLASALDVSVRTLFLT
jgi:transcriptional regulator with XRE-family HTH domain